MKILNLYAGIGGNRKLWGDEHEITAVEFNPKIAAVYQKFFPKDKVIIADAHQYLLDHLEDGWEFIWASPPCQTHTILTYINTYQIGAKKHPKKYIDLKLYQEIILLKTYFKGKYCIENVVSYYEPLIEPQEVGNHYFWANFLIPKIQTQPRRISQYYGVSERRKGLSLKGLDVGHRKDQVINNCVEPELGELILKSAFKEKQQELTL